MSAMSQGGPRRSGAMGSSAVRGAGLVGAAVILGIILLQVIDDGPSSGGDPGTVTVTSTPTDTTTGGSTTSSTTGSAGSARPRGEVRVVVLNGSGMANVATIRTNALRGLGYQLDPPNNTQLRQGSVATCKQGFEAEAQQLAEDVGAGVTVEEPFPNPRAAGVRERQLRRDHRSGLSAGPTRPPTAGGGARHGGGARRLRRFGVGDRRRSRRCPRASGGSGGAGGAARTDPPGGRRERATRRVPGPARSTLPGLVLVGQYGLERREGDRVVVDPRAAPYLPAVAAAADELDAVLPELLVERKAGVAVTVHWRQAPHLDQQAVAAVEEVAVRRGLTVYPTRMARELRPPVPVDKGTAVEGLLAGARSAMFAGDDRGDLEAFAALDRMEQRGELACAVKVAVSSEEAPPELLARGDLAVDGPAGLAALLTELAAAVDATGSGPFGGRDQVAQPPRRRPCRRQLAQPPRRLASFGSGHRQRPVECVRALLQVVGVHRQHRGLELVERARFGRQADDTVTLVDDRALLGHQVESVLQRVHEQHVVAGVPGDAAREVVAQLEHDRRRVVATPPLVHSRRGLLDLLPVRLVLGHALS